MNILICNAGSTSLKFKLFEMPAEIVRATGAVERIGSDIAIFHYKNMSTGYTVRQDGLSIPSYTDGIQRFFDLLTHTEYGVIADIADIDRVGFKTVLAKDFYGTHLLTRDVLDGMEEWRVVAPVHNGAYLEAIACFQALMPDTPLVGAFETDFHRTMPPEHYLYSVPYDWYEQYGVRRMGYHGASHGYVADYVQRTQGAGRKVLSCHLGGSCSLCAIVDGKSIDNTFGFSLQVGVLHSTRNGDIDPYILPYMMHMGLSMEEITRDLEKNGGLKGISGVSGDLRLVEEAADAGNRRAKLAIDMFVTSIIRCAGSCYAEMGGMDDLVFTGGIGEHGVRIRKAVCEKLAHMGIRLDGEKNETLENDGIISTPDSPVTVHVVRANEELVVARRTFGLKL